MLDKETSGNFSHLKLQKLPLSNIIIPMLDIFTFDHSCNTRKVAQNIPEEIGFTYHSFGVRNQDILEMCKGHQSQMTKFQKKHVSTSFSHNNNNMCCAVQVLWESTTEKIRKLKNKRKFHMHWYTANNLEIERMFPLT